MIGILLIYWVGRKFYEMANEYGKNRWGFAILGVASYYIGLLLGGVIIGVASEMISPGSLDGTADMLIGLMCVPFGILLCWGTYKLLENSWSKPKSVDNSTLDAGLINTEPERYKQDER